MEGETFKERVISYLKGTTDKTETPEIKKIEIKHKVDHAFRKYTLFVTPTNKQLRKFQIVEDFQEKY